MEDEWKSETMDFELVSRGWKIFHKVFDRWFSTRYIFRRNIVANQFDQFLIDNFQRVIPNLWSMISLNLFGSLSKSNRWSLTKDIAKEIDSKKKEKKLEEKEYDLYLVANYFQTPYVYRYFLCGLESRILL